MFNLAIMQAISGRTKLKWFLFIVLLGMGAFTFAEILLRTSLFRYLKTGVEQKGWNYMSPFKVEEENWYHLGLIEECRNQNTPEFNYESCYNNIGVRDINHSVKKNEATTRVIVLGDSFTEGVGAPLDSTWWRLLQSFLQNTVADSLHVEFVNGAVQGSDPFFSYVLLRDKLLSYQPDQIMLALNQSDITEISVRGGFERFQPDTTVRYRRKAPWWEPLYAHAFTFRAAYYHLISRDFFFRTQQEIAEDEEFAVSEICIVLHELKNMCNARNIRFTVILHPHYFEMQNNLDPFNPVRECLTLEGIEFIDLYPHFHAIPKHELHRVFWVQDGHCNPNGYLLMAQEIFKSLHSKKN